jgi:hypothetical protein
LLLLALIADHKFFGFELKLLPNDNGMLQVDHSSYGAFFFLLNYSAWQLGFLCSVAEFIDFLRNWL